MAFATFSPPNGKFSAGASEDHEPRVLSAGFGDGYAQETGDGINTDLLKLNVSWEVQTQAEGKIITDFFASKKGYIPFKFTLPGETTPRKFKCKKWSKNYQTADVVGITASWNEVADPE